MKIGDRVAYSTNFLQSIGCYTGPMANAKGTVTALVPLCETTLAEVDWASDEVPKRVNVKNLRTLRQVQLGQ